MQNDYPTREKADAYAETYVANNIKTVDANDLMYQVAASRTYDPSKSLAKIKAKTTWVNSADDFINPPELGMIEREIKRVKRGKFVMIPISAETRGHGTHTIAKIWQGYLKELLDQSSTAQSSDRE